LNYIEEGLRAKTGRDVILADYFDMIAGTSTGGILTGLLLHLERYSAQKAIKLYTERGKEIFSKSRRSICGLVIPKYSTRGIDSALADVFGDRKLSELSRDCLITAYDLNDCKAAFFRRSDARDDTKRDYLLRDVARATSAAPTYFYKKKMDDGKRFIDGGVFANNPSLCALVDVIYFNKIELKDIFVLSIGTGEEPLKKKQLKHKHFSFGVDVALQSIGIMLNSAEHVVHTQMENLFESAGYRENYIRIDPVLNTADFDMDNSKDKNINNLKADAQKDIGKQRNLLDKIIEKLITNSNE
jgi:patatin-like phospholipase/acyl hydrolase